jgi:hypothetical protein
MMKGNVWFDSFEVCEVIVKRGGEFLDLQPLLEMR